MRLSDLQVTIDKGFSLPDTSIDSPSLNLNLFAPSRLTHAALRPSTTFSTRIVTLAGSIIGLKDSEWGARGVRQMHLIVVSRIEPPAARLYAVEPVGVEIMIPSPTAQVILLSSM